MLGLAVVVLHFALVKLLHLVVNRARHRQFLQDVSTHEDDTW